MGASSMDDIGISSSAIGLGLAFRSDPGSKRSISLGDCPEFTGRGDSSNRLLKLLVTESASNRGRGNSRMYGGVDISNMGLCSNWISGKELGGVNMGGVGAAELKNESCIEMSCSGSPGGDIEVGEAVDFGLAVGTGSGCLRSIESADNKP